MTWCHKPGDSTLNTLCHENLTAQNFICYTPFMSPFCFAQAQYINFSFCHTFIESHYNTLLHGEVVDIFE